MVNKMQASRIEKTLYFHTRTTTQGANQTFFAISEIVASFDMEGRIIFNLTRSKPLFTLPAVHGALFLKMTRFDVRRNV